ncbi:hypothetical protein SLS58_006813 [Diplodia intermedia]|uniref:Uncharacterized protein n=1 Tax=Diplodia intermedia TaxID=856260 RepID=A0ABR3TLX3_9PEZI
MKDVDADVAHTFVHYLHTGEYQTLHSPALDGGPPIHPAEASSREHRRALLSYVAATNHELDGLRKLARERAEVICRMLAPWTVLQNVEAAYQNLQERDAWLDSHVKDFFRQCTAVTREGAGKELTKGLKNIFTCSLLDAVFDVFGAVVVQRDGDALETPMAPDMVSDENEGEGSSSELSFGAEVIELDQELERHGDEPQSPDAVTASIPDSELATVLEMPHGKFA